MQKDSREQEDQLEMELLNPQIEASHPPPSEPNTNTRNHTHTESFNDHPSESFSSDDSVDEEDNAEENGGGDDQELSLSELKYSADSFHAIARPVSTTMLLAALSAVYINNEQTIEMGAEQFASAYNVWEVDSEEGSNGQNLAASIGNAFVMVTAIATMTFGIVFLYKYRCMKFLIGYMVFSSASLLGLLGDYMGSIAIEIYRIPIDKISYSLFMYNFAIVGVTAIFYQKGIPQSVTQIYLVFTSVILSWHLSKFDDWTAWTLLVMLAFYDLCAVLSPCGPLKALVNLMSEKDSPDMPGLLYEAQLPAGTSKPGTTRSSNGNNSRTSSSARQDNVNVENQSHSSGHDSESESESESDSESEAPSDVHTQMSLDPTNSPIADHPESPTSPLTGGVRGRIPLALAKTYRLQLVSGYDALLSTKKKKSKRWNKNKDSSSINDSPLLADVNFYERQFSASQLLSEVEVEFPHNGGRIVKDGNDHKGRGIYKVFGKDGELRRALIVEKTGKVYEMSDDDDDESVDDQPGSIRLGLGDFIFYSVMVAKAAMYSFTTFAACMLVILAGLGGTLVLLSVYHSALPALPISIFLGVIFYLLTKVIIEPWIEVIMTAPIYV